MSWAEIVSLIVFVALAFATLVHGFNANAEIYARGDDPYP